MVITMDSAFCRSTYFRHCCPAVQLRSVCGTCWQLMTSECEFTVREHVKEIDIVCTTYIVCILGLWFRASYYNIYRVSGLEVYKNIQYAYV
jgi:hypothetical protein